MAYLDYNKLQQNDFEINIIIGFDENIEGTWIEYKDGTKRKLNSHEIEKYILEINKNQGILVEYINEDKEQEVYEKYGKKTEDHQDDLYFVFR